MCGRDEFCKLGRKRKAWVLGHSDRDREVYRESERRLEQVIKSVINHG